MAYHIATPRAPRRARATEHALVDDEGRPRRIPREERDALRRLCGAAQPEAKAVERR